ncbi:Bacteriophage protein [Mycolicibacterium smegmatis]|nr:Bacteriophage protein [Mycolicibacterium smegmatis]
MIDFPDFSIDFNRALAAIPEHIVGQHGVPDLTDPMSTYRYLEKRRETIINSVRQRPLLRLWDKNWNYIGQIAQEQSVMVEEVMADSGAGTCVIRRDNWLSDFILYDRRVEEDIHFTLDPIATKPDWRTRWGGKVIGVNAKRDAQGLHTVELEMVSNREHLKHLLAGANPLFPPEVQFPKMWVLPWNCRTALSITMFINLARQFFPFLSIPTNIFNPGGWLGVGAAGVNPLSWPIQVQFLNPVFDQSRFTIFTSRWSDMHSTSAPLLEDAGCMIRAYTWLTEDEESPHPELKLGLKNIPIAGPILKEIGEKTGLPTDLDELARPTRNCIVMAVEDKSGTTGPTGTFLDGPIKLIASTADDMITETISSVVDLDKDKDGETDPFFRKLALVAPEPPWVVFHDGEYSGIVEAQRSMHGATAKTIMVGSKSPAWVNQLQTFAIKYGLSQIQAVITAGIIEQVGEAPVGSGLEEVYQGQLDDTLLAWQRFTDPIRAIRMGDFGFLEHFEKGSGSAYTVSGVLDLRSGHWKTRAYTSFKTTIRNGAPYLVGYDFQLGDRLAFQMANVLHVDQCTAIRYSWDKSNPITVQLSIGRDVEEEDPVARATRTIAAAWNTIGFLLGSQDLF